MNKHVATAKPTQLNIKSAKARRLADELSALTGESLTDSVTAALEDRLAKERLARRTPGEVAGKLMEWGRRFSEYPIKDARSAEEILGYDENGLPS